MLSDVPSAAISILLFIKFSLRASTALTSEVFALRANAVFTSIEFALSASASFTSAVFDFKLILFESEPVSLLNLLLNIVEVSTILSFVLSETCVAALIGLSISAVLFTFSNPTFAGLIPIATFISVTDPSANLELVTAFEAILGAG